MRNKYSIDVTCAVRVSEYVLETERDNYISFCEENGYDPNDIWNEVRGGSHVYALALRAMGLDFEQEA